MGLFWFLTELLRVTWDHDTVLATPPAASDTGGTGGAGGGRP